MTKKKNIVLLIEDETSVRKLIASRLNEEGFDFLEAPDGKVGLKLALEKNPDLILLDIVMPVMDGMTFLKKLRANPKGKNIKVIVLTNLSNEEDLEESKKQGVDDFLIKADWKINDVIERIKVGLKKK